MALRSAISRIGSAVIALKSVDGCPDRGRYHRSILEHYVNMDLTITQDFTLDDMCEFFQRNRLEIDRIATKADPEGDLRDACHAAVVYRTQHGAGTSIDYLLDSLAKWVNNISTQKIDQDALTTLKDLVPALKQMDSAEVARAIISADPKIVSINQ